MIQLISKVEEIIVRDAESTFPEECCGFLFGYITADNNRIITEAQIVENVKEGDKRRRFVIHPKDYLKAESYADKHDLTLLGVYHSHPDHPAIPSEHDRIAAQPFFSYVILSVQSGRFHHARSWLLNDQGYFEEESFLHHT